MKNKEVSIIATTGIGKKENQMVFLGALAKNIMFPSNKYLVFCEDVEISKYLEEPYFRTLNSIFSYLNLDSDYSREGSKQKQQDTYTYYKDCEFFVSSKETLDALIEIKHYIIDKTTFKK